MGNSNDDRLDMKDDDLLLKIKEACVSSFGVTQVSFLCKSIGSLNLKSPITIHENTKLVEVIKLLQDNNSGCVIVTEDSGSVVGIFTERDCLKKVIGKIEDLTSICVRDVMTPNPICQTADCTIAYALNLMSGGGFRHIPLVDTTGMPIGILSVRDVVDHIAESMVNDILAV